MPKIFKFFPLFLILLSMFISPMTASADPKNASSCNITFDPNPPTQSMTTLSVTVQSNQLPAGNYYAVLNGPGGGNFMPPANSQNNTFPLVNGTVKFSFSNFTNQKLWAPGSYTFYAYNSDKNSGTSITSNYDCTSSFNITQSPEQSSCTTSIPTTPVNPDTSVGLKVSGITPGSYDIFINGQKSPNWYDTSKGDTVVLTNPQTNNTSFPPASYTVALEKNECAFGPIGCTEQLQCATVTFQSVPRGTQGGGQVGTGNTLPTFNPGNPSHAGIIDACGVETAIGCISTDPGSLVKQFLAWALGASGGIALLIMAIGAIQMIAASGNPEAVKAGRDRFTSAIIGLLFIIFAVFLLQVIGVSILNIPGFK